MCCLQKTSDNYLKSEDTFIFSKHFQNIENSFLTMQNTLERSTTENFRKQGKRLNILLENKQEFSFRFEVWNCFCLPETELLEKTILKKFYHG